MSLTPRIDNIESTNNIVINGGMDIWQRSVGPVGAGTTPTYDTADRWAIERSGSGGVNSAQSIQIPNDNFKYSLQLESLTADAKGMIAWQRIEGKDVTSLINKTVTLSAWVKTDITGGTYTLEAKYNDNGSEDIYASAENSTLPSISSTNPVLTVGVWERVSLTFTMPTSVKDGLVISLSASVAEANSMYITGVMLTEGSNVGNFKSRAGTPEGELLLCKRYYQLWTLGTTGAIAPAYQQTASAYRASLPLSTPLRTSPTIGFDALANYRIRTSTEGILTPTSMTTSSTGSNLLSLNLGVAAANGTMGVLISNGAFEISADAEL